MWLSISHQRIVVAGKSLKQATNNLLEEQNLVTPQFPPPELWGSFCHDISDTETANSKYGLAVLIYHHKSDTKMATSVIGVAILTLQGL